MFDACILDPLVDIPESENDEPRGASDILPFPAMCISPEVTLDWQEAGGAGVAWHSDYTIADGRADTAFDPKLVAIVQPSDPADYDGGEFEIYIGTQMVHPRLEPTAVRQVRIDFPES